MTTLDTTIPWLTRVAQRWQEAHTLGPKQLPSLSRLAARKRNDGRRVSVVLPARDESGTIGKIVRCISEQLMDRVPLVDELLVVDGGSADHTAELARDAGATVVRVEELLADVPVAPGKGESLWRSLVAVTGDVVVWVDADIRNFAPHFVTRLVAPLIEHPDAAFVKAFYRRPIVQGKVLMPRGGGRVTELLARPLLNTFFPELGGFFQPLAGEYAGRRDVLERIPFFTGYGVEAGMLIDLLEIAGLDAMYQVDLTERVHRNRPLEELSAMAFAIAHTILRRAEERRRARIEIDYSSNPLLLPSEGGLVAQAVTQLERPPIELVRPSLRAIRGGRLVAAR